MMKATSIYHLELEDDNGYTNHLSLDEKQLLTLWEDLKEHAREKGWK